MLGLGHLEGRGQNVGQGGTELVMQQVSRYGIMLTRSVSISAPVAPMALGRVTARDLAQHLSGK